MNTELQKTNSKTTPDDWEQWLGNLIWRKVQCLVERPDFNPSPKWIVMQLNISLLEAVDAIEGLERLGCIERVGSTFKTVSNWHQLTRKDLAPTRLLRAQLLVSNSLLNKLKADDKFTSQVFRANDAILEKYAPKFIELFKQMNDEGIQNNCTDVYGSQLTFSKLTTNNETTGGL